MNVMERIWAAIWLACLVSACGSDRDTGQDAAGDSGTEREGASVPDAGSDGAQGAADGAVIDCSGTADWCVSAHGVRDGRSFHCYRDTLDASRVYIGTERWSVDCSEGLADFTTYVDFPIQQPGPIDIDALVDGFAFGAEARFGSAGSSMLDTSSNLVSAELTGTIQADNTATGTLTAVWGEPSADCDSGGGPATPCGQGTLVLSFRVLLP